MTKEEGEQTVRDYGAAQEKADEAAAAAADGGSEKALEAQNLAFAADTAWERMYDAWQELSAG